MKILNTDFVVPGFSAWGVSCGIKKVEKKDLAILYSDREAAVAGVFTRNRVKAACVTINAGQIKKGRGRVIVANSGCANACTGKQGHKDAHLMARLAAAKLGVPPDSVYTASTGVIGALLPMKKVEQGIDACTAGLSPSGLPQAAEAIMTTDLFSKTAAVREKIGGRTVTIAGIAKGSGMIHPDMATMLCFILTDANITPGLLGKTLSASVEASFNSITVDGDTSTNDMVLCMANGAAGGKKIAAGTADMRKFQSCLDMVASMLAKQIVRDGEGATKFVEITVLGAKNAVEAKRAAVSVARSSLVKTAIFGEDANWGRIMAALGYSGIDMDESGTDISIGRTKLVSRGIGRGKEAENEATAALQQRDVRVTINLRKGKAQATVWTCDLSYDYVKINAAYRS